VAMRTKAPISSDTALPTELLRSGATLSEIGQLLRHESPDTTRIYAKVDIEALRTLSLPWPGGAQ
jgi:site-specific recombinase XerD